MSVSTSLVGHHSPADATTVLPATSTRERGAGRGLLIIGCTWLLLFLIILQVTDTGYRLFMLSGILTALTLPLAIQHIRQGLDLFEPLVFANLSMASMFLGRPLFDISANHWYDHWFKTYLDVRPGFDFMLQVTLIGVIGFQTGYLCGIPEKLALRLPRGAVKLNLQRASIVALAVFLLGFVLFLAYVISSGGYGFLLAYITTRLAANGTYSYKAASGYLLIGPLFWPPATAILFYIWMKTRRSAQLYMATAIMALFLLVNLGNGSRTFIIQGVFSVLVIWYMMRNKRPGVLLIAPAVVAGLFFLTFTREARTATTLEEKETVISKVLQDPGKSVLSIWSEDDAAMIDYFSVMVSNIPSKTPFGHFSTITDILLRAYPRFMWPNGQKPDEHMVFLFKYFFPTNYYEYQTGASCSLVAELYDDYGTPAAFIGMFIFGITLGMAKPWVRYAKDSLPVLLFYAVMPAYTISLMRGGVPAFVEYLAISAIPGILLTRFAKASPAT